MKIAHAEQIAHLLNTQNRLTVNYDAQRVLGDADDYLIDFSENGQVACCAQLKHVQWYQAEVCHVTTHPDYARQGRGLRMIELAEQKAREQGARLLQSTIRVGNVESEGLFTKAGFARGTTFRNAASKNNVAVWAKALYAPE